MEKGKIKEKAAMEVFKSLPEGIQEDFLTLARQTDSPEEYIRVISVGDCPVCGSNKTRDCENTLETFEKGQTTCEHWGICADCSSSTYLKVVIPHNLHAQSSKSRRKKDMDT